MASKNNNAQGESKRPTGRSDRALIAASSASQKRAIARGRTVGRSGSRVTPEPFTLRQRAMYPDEYSTDAGFALNRARTSGVLRGIRESKADRDQSGKVARAMGRENIRVRKALGKRIAPGSMGEAKNQTSLPHFLTHRVGDAAVGHVSDLTKTKMGAPTRRKGRAARSPFGRNRLKTPTEGGRKRRRKRRRTRKRKRRRTRRRKRIQRRRSRRRR